MTGQTQQSGSISTFKLPAAESCDGDISARGVLIRSSLLGLRFVSEHLRRRRSVARDACAIEIEANNRRSAGLVVNKPSSLLIQDVS